MQSTKAAHAKTHTQRHTGRIYYFYLSDCVCTENTNVAKIFAHLVVVTCLSLSGWMTLYVCVWVWLWRWCGAHLHSNSYIIHCIHLTLAHAVHTVARPFTPLPLYVVTPRRKYTPKPYSFINTYPAAAVKDLLTFTSRTRPCHELSLNIKTN